MKVGFWPISAVQCKTTIDPVHPSAHSRGLTRHAWRPLGWFLHERRCSAIAASWCEAGLFLRLEGVAVVESKLIFFIHPLHLAYQVFLQNGRQFEVGRARSGRALQVEVARDCPDGGLGITVKNDHLQPALIRIVQHFAILARVEAVDQDRIDQAIAVDIAQLGNLETESKLYFDDEIGVYIPATWITEAIICAGFSVAKIGRAKMRGGLFATEPKIKLKYRGMNKVKTITDVVMNSEFRHRMLLKQGQVRVPKDAPIFHDWSFETAVEFDDTVVDMGSLRRIVERSAKYGGFGDFRPTFGRANAEVLDV